MRAIALAVGVALATLVFAAPAAAHPQFWPAFVEQNAETDLLLTAPNERKAAMTAIELAAPATVELLAARSTPAWQAELTDGRATWTGGRLATDKWGQFPLRLRALGEPGGEPFTVRQRFADGKTVDWPVTLSVTPGAATPPSDGSPSSWRAFAAITAVFSSAVTPPSSLGETSSSVRPSTATICAALEASRPWSMAACSASGLTPLSAAGDGVLIPSSGSLNSQPAIRTTPSESAVRRSVFCIAAP